MAFFGAGNSAEAALEMQHREQGLKRIEELRERADEHQRPDLDRLWQLIVEASRSS